MKRLPIVYQGLAYPATRRRRTARAVFPPPRPEADFQHVIVELARSLGWLVYHPHDSRNSEGGWPDLALCKPPRFILAELKSRSGVISPDQERWLAALGASGIETHVWRDTGDLRSIAEILTGR